VDLQTIERAQEAWRSGLTHGQIKRKFPDLSNMEEFAINIIGENMEAEELLPILEMIKPKMSSDDVIALFNQAPELIISNCHKEPFVPSVLHNRVILECGYPYCYLNVELDKETSEKFLSQIDRLRYKQD